MAPSPGIATGRTFPLKWLHLRFVCEIATDAEVPTIWSGVATAKTKQEGISILSQYLLMWMELCHRNLHMRAKILHVGGALYKFVSRYRFVNPGTNPP